MKYSPALAPSRKCGSQGNTTSITSGASCSRRSSSDGAGTLQPLINRRFGCCRAVLQEPARLRCQLVTSPPPPLLHANLYVLTTTSLLADWTHRFALQHTATQRFSCRHQQPLFDLLLPCLHCCHCHCRPTAAPLAPSCPSVALLGSPHHCSSLLLSLLPLVFRLISSSLPSSRLFVSSFSTTTLGTPSTPHAPWTERKYAASPSASRSAPRDRARRAAAATTGAARAATTTARAASAAAAARRATSATSPATSPPRARPTRRHRPRAARHQPTRPRTRQPAAVATRPTRRVATTVAAAVAVAGAAGRAARAGTEVAEEEAVGAAGM